MMYPEFYLFVYRWLNHAVILFHQIPTQALQSEVQPLYISPNSCQH